MCVPHFETSVNLWQNLAHVESRQSYNVICLNEFETQNRLCNSNRFMQSLQRVALQQCPSSPLLRVLKTKSRLFEEALESQNRRRIRRVSKSYAQFGIGAAARVAPSWGPLEYPSLMSCLTHKMPRDRFSEQYVSVTVSRRVTKQYTYTLVYCSSYTCTEH